MVSVSNPTKPRFFRSPADFRRWLEKNHNKTAELTVGFFKKDSGRKSVTYAEALDEALCFGWIDGVRRRVDENSYSIRFTPRKPRSIWSLINTRKVKELIRLGRMHQAGLDAFELRDPTRTGIYSFENAPRKLAPEYEKSFRANKKAWDFFNRQPPGYQRLATYWVMSAKQEQTRLRRLNLLIDNSEKNIRERTVTAGKD
ncbi:MAG TPA: YdeI/OmpD-associated family protein [Pyrinomonadaceae bacterium]|nr:YdeI/OmpD-associated family protein [Pyrinomonadaceae bacterium]